jgi:hypothetical protein
VYTLKTTKQTRHLSINQYLHISRGKKNGGKGLGTEGLFLHKGGIHRAPNPTTKQVEEKSES